MVTLLCPVLGFLRQESIVEDAPPFDKAGLARFYYIWEEGLEPPSQRFGQDLVQASEQCDWAPVSEFGMVPELGYQSYEPFVNQF